MPRKPSRNQKRRPKQELQKISVKVVETLGRRPKKKTGKRKKKGKRKMQSMGHPLVDRYLAAMSHPFSEEARNAKSIDLAARNSFPVTAKTRLILSLASGARALLFPQLNCSSDTPTLLGYAGNPSTNLATTYYFSTAALTAGVTQINTLNPTFPFTQQTLYNNEVDYRKISKGIKVSFNGQKLNQGGSVVWCESLNGINLLTGGEATTLSMNAFYTSILALPHTRYCSFNVDNEHEFQYSQAPYTSSPVWTNGDSQVIYNNTDTRWVANEVGNFIQSFGSSAAGGTQYGGYLPTAVLVINNTSAATAEYIIEIVDHAEFSGGNLSVLMTPSEPRIESHATIRNAISQAKATHSATPHTHPGDHLLNTLSKHVGKQVGAHLKAKAVKGASTLLAGLLV